MYLLDTNIFLEILLDQEKKEDCKNFLNQNLGKLRISDFALHSIGVILFRQNKQSVFQDFVSEILPRVKLLSLLKRHYSEIVSLGQSASLVFDEGERSLIGPYGIFGMNPENSICPD